MPLRWRLVVFGWPALEIATAWWVATKIGWGNLIGIVILSAVLGVIVIRAAGRAAFGELRQAQAQGVMPQGNAGRHAGTFIAGVLIAIPGLWTTLVGLVFLLPPIRAILMPIAASWVAARATVRMSRGQTTIIQGTVIRPEDPPRQTPPPSIEAPEA